MSQIVILFMSEVCLWYEACVSIFKNFSPPPPQTYTDDIGTHELDDTADSFVDVEGMDDPEASSPDSKHSGGEDLVVLDDVSETDKEDAPGHDDDRRISTTSDDVLGGISGEGAELHPEFDDFEDDQHFEVLETADGDLSEGQESSELEQSPSAGSADRETGKEKDREKLSSEKLGMNNMWGGVCMQISSDRML